VTSTTRPVVLIVDDNRMNIDLMVEILKNDYTLRVAVSGEAALDIVQDSLPDIILLDIMMPDMDGYEVCKRLKSDERTKAVPVIFITAKAQIEDEAKGLEYGAVDYLTKPVSPAIVLARVKTHIALYDQNRTLEEQVQKRTKQLAESKKKAEEASKAKSAFLANVSHELRTPLNHVMGLSSLLLEIDENQERLELIKPIHDGAEQLTSLFNQLLDLTMLESDAVNIDFRTFDLERALSQQAAIFRAYAKKKSLDFQFSMQEGIPTKVYGAPAETVQTLNNVLLNACRYTDEGKVTLTVGIDPEQYAGLDKGMVMLRFIVTDSGVGIPEDKQETIFDSFEIGEEVMTKRLSGTGIGLTISKYLVEKMNGKIWVESQVGQGSKFSISLPFKVETE